MPILLCYMEMKFIISFVFSTTTTLLFLLLQCLVPHI
jgi:hypothetical protein